jgi:hypothetical protein
MSRGHHDSTGRRELALAFEQGGAELWHG